MEFYFHTNFSVFISILCIRLYNLFIFLLPLITDTDWLALYGGWRPASMISTIKRCNILRKSDFFVATLIRSLLSPNCQQHHHSLFISQLLSDCFLSTFSLLSSTDPFLQIQGYVSTLPLNVVAYYKKLFWVIFKLNSIQSFCSKEKSAFCSVISFCLHKVAFVCLFFYHDSSSSSKFALSTRSCGVT